MVRVPIGKRSCRLARVGEGGWKSDSISAQTLRLTTLSLQAVLDVQARRNESNQRLDYHSQEAELLRTTLRSALPPPCLVSLMPCHPHTLPPPCLVSPHAVSHVRARCLAAFSFNTRLMQVRHLSDPMELLSENHSTTLELGIIALIAVEVGKRPRPCLLPRVHHATIPPLTPVTSGDGITDSWRHHVQSLARFCLR